MEGLGRRVYRDVYRQLVFMKTRRFFSMALLFTVDFRRQVSVSFESLVGEVLVGDIDDEVFSRGDCMDAVKLAGLQTAERHREA